MRHDLGNLDFMLIGDAIEDHVVEGFAGDLREWHGAKLLQGSLGQRARLKLHTRTPIAHFERGDQAYHEDDD